MNTQQLTQWLCWWKPHPIKPPHVDREFMHMEGFQRSVECWRYCILGIEYWLCPEGSLREFIRHVLRVVVILLLPAFLIVPIITFVLSQFVSWTIMLTTIAWKVIVLPILALIAIVVMAIVRMVLGVIITGK